MLTQSEVINANVSPVSGSMKTINVSTLMSAKSLISAVPIQLIVLIPQDPTSAFARTGSSCLETRRNASKSKMNVNP